MPLWATLHSSALKISKKRVLGGGYPRPAPFFSKVFRRSGWLLPHQREDVAGERRAGRHADERLHNVGAAGVVGGLFRHQVDGDGAAHAGAMVDAGAVPGEAAVEMHMALLHRAHDDMHRLALESFRQLAAL